MIVFTDEGIDLKKLEVADLIDIQLLQRFLDNFAIAVNCAAVAVGRDGKPITRPSHYRKFCNKFINVSPIGSDRCAKCHRQMGENAKIGRASCRERVYVLG